MSRLSLAAEITERFSNLDLATNTLYGLMNGDSLHDYFETLAPSGQSAYRNFVSRFYLYSFISLFIYTVYNLFWVRRVSPQHRNRCLRRGLDCCLTMCHSSACSHFKLFFSRCFETITLTGHCQSRICLDQGLSAIV